MYYVIAHHVTDGDYYYHSKSGAYVKDKTGWRGILMPYDEAHERIMYLIALNEPNWSFSLMQRKEDER